MGVCQYKLRIRYCQELLSTFAEMDWEMRGNFLRAEADAYWYLGEIETAEQKFVALIAQNPDWAWGYIGWSDHLWLYHSSSKNYERAEKILQQALARRNLEDRAAVHERLIYLHNEKPGLPAPGKDTPAQKTPSLAPAWDMRKWKKKRPQALTLHRPLWAQGPGVGVSMDGHEALDDSCIVASPLVGGNH